MTIEIGQWHRADRKWKAEGMEQSMTRFFRIDEVSPHGEIYTTDLIIEVNRTKMFGERRWAITSTRVPVSEKILEDCKPSSEDEAMRAVWDEASRAAALIEGREGEE